MTDPTATLVLLDQFRNGDASALNALYARYVNRVLAIVRARLGPELRSRVESWDIVQDAMLASLRGIDTFEYTSEGAFLRWFGQIVENRIRDQLAHERAARRDHRLEKPLENPRSSDTSAPLDIAARGALPTPSQILMHGEDLLRLEQALDLLPADARDLIIAVKLEERTYQEIADDLGKTADAIRMQVNRAMDHLSEVFHRLDGKQS